MSASSILSQANPSLLCAVPTWRAPVLMHLRATIAGASGAATVVAQADATTGEAGTTPGVSIVRQAAGTYALDRLVTTVRHESAGQGLPGGLITP